MSKLQDELRRWTDEAFGLEFSADVHVERLERLLRRVDDQTWDGVWRPRAKEKDQNRRILTALRDERSENDDD